MSLFNTNKIILILYEKSGVFTELYRQAGYTVITWDIQLDGEDIRLKKMIGAKKIHGLMSFTPCTHLAGSGARWWAGKGESALLEALSLADASMRFVALLKPEWWVLENPVGRLTQYYGKPSFIFNPCDYGGYIPGGGDRYTKKTCLWGKFTIPEKKPVEPTEGSKMHLIAPGPDRADLRSKTPQGFAKAFFEYNQ